MNTNDAEPLARPAEVIPTLIYKEIPKLVMYDLRLTTREIGIVVNISSEGVNNVWLQHLVSRARAFEYHKQFSIDL